METHQLVRKKFCWNCFLFSYHCNIFKALNRYETFQLFWWLHNLSKMSFSLIFTVSDNSSFFHVTSSWVKNICRDSFSKLWAYKNVAFANPWRNKAVFFFFKKLSLSYCYVTTEPGKGLFKSFPQLCISFHRHNYLEGTTYLFEGTTQYLEQATY